MCGSRTSVGPSCLRTRSTALDIESGSLVDPEQTHSDARVLLLCQCWLGFQRGVDGAGELAFEAADRFAAAFPFGLFAFEVSACGCVDAALGVGSE